MTTSWVIEEGCLILFTSKCKKYDLYVDTLGFANNLMRNYHVTCYNDLICHDFKFTFEFGFKSLMKQIVCCYSN